MQTSLPGMQLTHPAISRIGHLYLRESKQKHADGSVASYLQLAENRWNPDKQRAETRIMCKCGRADDPAVILPSPSDCGGSREASCGAARLRRS